MTLPQQGQRGCRIRHQFSAGRRKLKVLHGGESAWWGVWSYPAEATKSFFIDLKESWIWPASNSTVRNWEFSHIIKTPLHFQCRQELICSIITPLINFPQLSSASAFKHAPPERNHSILVPHNLVQLIPKNTWCHPNNFKPIFKLPWSHKERWDIQKEIFTGTLGLTGYGFRVIHMPSFCLKRMHITALQYYYTL